MTIGTRWLRQKLLHDRAAVAEQVGVCSRLMAAALAVTGVSLVLLATLGSQGTVLFILLSSLAIAGFVATLVVARLIQVVIRESVVIPLDEVTSIARRLGGGDLDTETVDPTTGPAEFQQITATFGILSAAVRTERTNRAADKRAGDTERSTLRQILRSIQQVGSTLVTDEILQELATAAKAIGGYETAAIWWVDELENKLVLAFTSDAEDARKPGMASLPLAGTPLGRSVMTSQVMRLRGDDVSPAGLAVPVMKGGGLAVVGVVELRGELPAARLTDQIDALDTLATYGAAALEAARLHHEAEQRSEIDALTRIFNRRKLEADLKAEVARSLRYGHPLALVMVDVDHFKGVNDTFGHQQGDEVLKLVALTLARDRRETDSAYRFGGEEFALLLRETDAPGALEVAERLRIRIAEAVAALGLSRPVTASLGIAVIGGEIDTQDKLVEAADGALYQAKETGRNRVIVSSRVAKM